MNARTRFLDVGTDSRGEKVRLFVTEEGDPSAPVTLLLHGFPEFHGCWDEVRSALARGGRRAIAPDLRGFGRSSVPREVVDYRLSTLADDVVALAEGRPVHLVGHDWGAALAWHVAMHRPEVVSRLSILNVPHPERMARGLRTFRQLRKSWYMGFFQLPYLPEQLMKLGDYLPLRRTLAADGATPDRVERYVDAAKASGGLGGGINYYRAIVRDLVAGRADPPKPIDVPVQVLWGCRDRFLGEELATPDPSFVPHLDLRFFPQATHWLPQDCPAEVSAELLRFGSI